MNYHVSMFIKTIEDHARAGEKNRHSVKISQIRCGWISVYWEVQTQSNGCYLFMAKGCEFAKLCQMTDAFEGSIIRCVRRLEELLRQMCRAAKVIRNTDLEQKFSEAIKSIKRDIVFAASLYLWNSFLTVFICIHHALI